MLPGIASRPLWLAVVTLIMTCGAKGEAQVIAAPERTRQRQAAVDRRPGQRLTLGADLLFGGFEDTRSPEASGTPELLPRASGSMGFGAVRLHYEIGTPERAIAVLGEGFMYSFRNADVAPRYGAQAELRGRTQIGGRTEVDVVQTVRDDPFLALGGFTALQAPAQQVGVSPSFTSSTTGIAEARSLALSTVASIRRRWGRQTNTRLSYSFDNRNYDEALAFDSRTHVVSMVVDRPISRSVSLEGSYSYRDFRSIDAEGNLFPIEDQTLETGLKYGRNLSRTRRVEFSGGGGTLLTRTVDPLTSRPRHFWGPSGFATASMDLTRTWTATADYRRSLSVLQGRTAQAFLTNSGTIHVGGLLTNRVEAVFALAHSSGQTDSALGTHNASRFDNQAMTTQLNILLTSSWSTLVSYGHYRYNLNHVASQSLGIPPRLQRNTVQVGFALQFPLVGASTGRVRER